MKPRTATTRLLIPPTLAVTTLAVLVLPAHAEAGDPVQSTQVVVDSTTPSLVIANRDPVKVQLRMRYHSFFDADPAKWTPDTVVPDVVFSPNTAGDERAVLRMTGRADIPLVGPSQDGEADDEARLEDGKSKADDKYILTGRFTASVDPTKLAFGSASLNYAESKTIEMNGPDDTYYATHPAGSVPISIRAATRTSIHAPATIPANPADLHVFGQVTGYSPGSDRYTATGAGETVSLQRVNEARNQWEIIAGDRLDASGRYDFDSATIEQAPGQTARYRVHYDASSVNALSNSDTVSIAPTPPPATVPGRPTSLSATRGRHKVTVYWDGPTTNGGHSLIGFQVKRSPGHATRTTGPTGRQLTFRHLQRHTRYTFSVRARNDLGRGPAAHIVVRTR